MRAIYGFSRFAVAGLCLALACMSHAFAVPVMWTLSGATFNDGGTATGSFVYDADTNTLSNWSVSVAGGNTATFPPITYDTTTASGSISGQGATTTGVNLAAGGNRQLRTPSVSPLSNAGGTVAIDISNIYQGECFNCSPYRPYTAGNLVGVVVVAITSAPTTSFTTGSAGSFTVMATGSPAPALSESGALPSGVSFVDNGDGTATLSGTPAAGTNGTYPLTLTASNGVAPDGTQNFTLIVQVPVVPTPGLTSVGMLVLGLLLLVVAAFAANPGMVRRE
jgi:hypothetical protein